MARTLAHAVLAVCVFNPVLFGQDSDLTGDSELKIEIPRGIHIYNITVYSGYMTNAYPTAGIALNLSSGFGKVGPDENYGAQIQVGWQHHHGRTDVSAVYSGGYSGMVHYSGVSGLNQTVDLSVSRELTPKLTLSLSGWASDQTIAQFLFQPQQLSVITQAPLSFQDFAAALSVGQFSNSQIASMLTGAPILQSPSQSLLYGDRILSYSGVLSLSYAYSSRLNFHVSGFTAEGQNRLGATTSGVPANYVMPRSEGANAGVGFTYMLSPRTSVGFDGGEYMLWNRYQRVRGTNATMSLGRKMTEHLSVHMYGGGSLMQMLQAGASQPTMHTIIGGGSLGIKGYSSSLALSYDRSSYDTYGFAAGVVTSESASWSWRHAGSSWSVFAGFGEEQLRNTGFASLSGWQASGGIGIQLARQVSMQLQYAHMRSAGTYNGFFNQFQVDSIRLSLGWVPVRFSR
jgi:hypothetical protein